MSGITILQPPGWPRPKGYANGMAATGRLVVTGGMVGWTPEGRFEARDLAGQVAQTLANLLAVLAEAGAGPEHVVSMTWYILSRADYHREAKAIGAAWRAAMGRHYPAMAVVEVSGLMEAEALVEIQALAVVPVTAA